MGNFIKKNKDIFFVILVGLVLSVLCMIDVLLPLRWIIGIPFVFFLSGYPLSTLFRFDDAWERLMASSGLSLLMTYPAAIITAAIEGKTDGQVIFGPHVGTSIAVLVGIVTITSVLAVVFRYKSDVFTRPNDKISRYKLAGIVFVSTLLNFINLGRADLNGDEYDIGYRAYYLVDGMVAGRNGYLLSFMGHTPLAPYINHFSMQLLNSSGFENLTLSAIRFAPAFIGVLCVVFLYKLGREFFSEKVGLWAALILATSNYHVWISRIFLREVFMTFFIILIVYFFFRAIKEKGWSNKILTGIFFGALLLTKILGGFLALAMIIFLLIYRRKHFVKNMAVFAVAGIIFLPVVAYNIGAYIKTGYMDIFFSRLFGIEHPFGYTGEKAHSIDYSGIFELLIDQYSLWLVVFFLIAILFAAKKTKEPHVMFQLILAIATVLFFMIAGYRAYYIPFITIPLALMAAVFITESKRKLITTGLSILIIGYASWYSYQTNISISYAVEDEWIDSGRSGYTSLPIEPFEYNYSRSARAWSENRGWQNLQAFLEEQVDADTTLILDEDLDPQALNFYLDVNQVVKQYYFDGNYQERYTTISMEEFLSNPTGGYMIVTSGKDFTYELVATITNMVGDPKFKIYNVEASAL